MSESQGCAEGLTWSRYSNTQLVCKITNKETFVGSLYSQRGKKKCPKGNMRNLLLKHHVQQWWQADPQVLPDTGSLPRMSTPSLDFLALSSQVVTTNCMPLSFLCITTSLAASSGAQQALEVSQTGRVVETGGTSSEGHSKERVWKTWGSPPQCHPRWRRDLSDPGTLWEPPPPPHTHTHLY